MKKETIIGLLTALTIAVPAHADTVFTSTLSGANEAPVPNASPATGSITVTLSSDKLRLDVVETFSGLTAPTNLSFIQVGSPDVSSPVALNFGDFGFPNGVTSGTYSHTFTLATDLFNNVSPRPSSSPT